MYKIYRVFSQTNNYYMISKLKSNLCFNLLSSYYKKYVEANRPETLYKQYFQIFEDGECKIESVGEYENRENAKQALKVLETNQPNIIKKKSGRGELNKTANLREYNKNKYRENKEEFKKYYETNREKIRLYQKKRYQELKSKLQELEEIKRV